MCIWCAQLWCTTAQSWSNNLPSYPPDNHLSSDVVCWRGRGNWRSNFRTSVCLLYHRRKQNVWRHKTHSQFTFIKLEPSEKQWILTSVNVQQVIPCIQNTRVTTEHHAYDARHIRKANTQNWAKNGSRHRFVTNSTDYSTTDVSKVSVQVVTMRSLTDQSVDTAAEKWEVSHRIATTNNVAYFTKFIVIQN